METFYVYIIYSTGHDKYYIGQTNNIDDRMRRHNSGQSQYTSSYIPWEIKLIIEKPSRSASMELERKLKNLSRVRLERFMEKYG